METKDIIIKDKKYQKLLHNDIYYKDIFKKTEKIVSVVFYILHNSDVDKKSETHVGNVAGKAHFVHENVLRTLEVKPANAKEVLEQFAQALVGLDSTLRIATVGGLVRADVLAVVVEEIDGVLRRLKQFIRENVSSEQDLFSQWGTDVSATSQAVTTRPRPRIASATERSETSVGGGDVHDRRERIKTILEARGESTIKDIAEIVTDVSEKTIQRELNAMIEEGVVKRQGERRWSKYYIEK